MVYVLEEAQNPIWLFHGCVNFRVITEEEMFLTFISLCSSQPKKTILTNTVHRLYWVSYLGIFFRICIYEVLPKPSPLVIKGNRCFKGNQLEDE